MYLLNRLLSRWISMKVAFWIANFIAALAFGAAHLGSAMVLLGGTSLAVISPFVMSEIFLINGVLVSGAQPFSVFHMRNRDWSLRLASIFGRTLFGMSSGLSFFHRFDLG